MACRRDKDLLYLNLLQSMDELVKSKVEMEKNMSEGFILLAKARLLLGKERISTMQIPTNDEAMTARYCVHRNSSKEDMLSLEQEIETLTIEASSEADIGKSDGEMLLRHRKSDKKQETAVETADVETQDPEEELIRRVLSKKSDSEPLKWFGVLVPQELKMAQKAFEKSLSLSIDCANIQNRIENNREVLKAMKATEKCV